MAQKLFLLEVRALGLEGEVLLNGVPLVSLTDTGTRTRVVQEVTNRYVVPGTNVLEVRADSRGAVPPALLARLVRTERQSGAPEYPLAAIVAPDPERPDAPVARRIEETRTFDAGEAFGTWIWQRAETIRADLLRDRKVLAQAVLDLHGHFARREMAPLLDLLGTRFEEMGRALQLPPDELRDRAREHYAGLFAQPEWTLQPVREADLQFRAVAEGRLVVVTTTAGRPLIASAAGMPFSLAVTLCQQSTAPRCRIVR
jgi:hypothetical protein